MILGLIGYLHIEGDFVTQVKAQANKEEEYEKLYECYRNYYNECFNNLLLDFSPRKIDQFGIVGLDDEQARLDNLAIEFRNNPKLQIYVVIYGGKINKVGELKERANRITKYLIQNRQLDLKKITVINGGFREKFEFELWLSQSEKIFPALSPTVDPERVIFKGKMKTLPVELGT